MDLEDTGERVDLRTALADARARPWLYRLPDEERRRLLFVVAYCQHDGIRAAAENALALDEEARNAP